MVATPFPMVAKTNLVHPEKAELPMVVTLSGIVTLVRAVHPEKAETPMVVVAAVPIVTLVSPVQS